MAKRSTVTVRLDGLDDVLAELARRSDKGKAALEAALTAGGEIIAAAARQNVTSTSQSVARAIIVTPTSTGKGKPSVVVHLGEHTWLGRFIEYGTRAHVVVPSSRKALLFRGRYAAHVHSPGMAARPFLRPAFDEQHQRAQDVIRQQLARAIL